MSNHCESKIRTACQQFPDREWSGAAFYKIAYINGKNSTNASIDDIRLDVIDFCLQDVGSSVYTEYDLNSDTASYMADHIDTLAGAKVCLMHSHNRMKAFLSGTDMNTLHEQAAQCNNVLSIVVNNEGTYVAKFTQKEKVIQADDVTTDTVVTTTYSFLGEDNRDKQDKYSDFKQYKAEYYNVKVYDCVINRPTNVPIDEAFKQECIDLDNKIKEKKAEKNASVDSVILKNTDRHGFTGWLFDDYKDKYVQPNHDIELLARSILFLSLDIKSLKAPRDINDVPIYHVDVEVIESFLEAWLYYFYSNNRHQFIDDELTQVREMLQRYISFCSLPDKDNLYHKVIDTYDFLIEFT